MVLLAVAWCGSGAWWPSRAIGAAGAVLAASEQPADTLALRSPVAGEQVAQLSRPQPTGDAVPRDAAVRAGRVLAAIGASAAPPIPFRRRRRVPARRLSRAPDESS